MKKLILPALAVLALSAGVMSPSFAERHNDHQEAQYLLAGAKITLAEAAAKAEALHADSRAFDAELDQNADGKAVWEVTVVTSDKSYDVILAADNGAVISNVEDRD